MDTSVEFKRVLEKQKVGAPVNVREVAVAIANDPRSLFEYIANNDYKQAYRLLHESENAMQIGQNAGFFPDKKRVEGELGLLIAKSDSAVLNQILNGFVINPATNNWTTNSELLASLTDIEAIKASPDGYKFSIKLG